MNEANRLLVLSWLTKSQHDPASAEVLSRSPLPLLDTAIYHCQQAAEKSVKGFLVFCDDDFERVHDVEALVRSALPYEPRFAAYLSTGRMLTPYARIFRNQGITEQPSLEQFSQAFNASMALYDFVLSLLPNDVQPAPLREATESDADLTGSGEVE